LQYLVDKLGLRDSFHFAGRQADVTPFINSACIGVLTSISEGFSNALLEYMGAGLPVVATDVGGNSEVVRDGETGFLFPVGNHQVLAEKLIRLLMSPDLAVAIGSNGRELAAREFSLDVMIHKHEDYYRGLIA
jgi:glycosyltransferase involved in cell wall biosynthesis